jgi:positive regulator of sigma E activity
MSVEATVCSRTPDGTVELEFSQSHCAGCAGSCTWRRALDAHRARFRCGLSLCEGDVVRVSLPANHLLMSAMLLHGLPLVALLAGAAVGAWVGQSDLGSLIGAMAGLVLVLVATPRLRRRMEKLTVEQVRLDPLP